MLVNEDGSHSVKHSVCQVKVDGRVHVASLEWFWDGKKRSLSQCLASPAPEGQHRMASEVSLAGPFDRGHQPSHMCVCSGHMVFTAC